MNARPLILTALLSLAACAAPTTYNPTVTQAELAQEQQAQATAAKMAPINFNEKKPYGHNQVDALAMRLTPVATRISRASSSLCTDLRTRRDCRFNVELAAKERGLNAHADGNKVVIYPAMVDFARNDTHLAFVIAHEFAHNIMGHIDAQKHNVTLGALLGVAADVAAGAGGVNSQGAFSELGAKQGLLRFSPQFESEADYVGLYILARAGYPIEQAPDFWRIMSQAQPDSIYVTQSHPNNPSRTIAMEKTVAEIRNKQRLGQPLMPNIRPKE